MTLFLQFVFNLGISQMWVYFCALQLVILVSKEAAIQLPLSTSRFVDSVYYSITLRPLKDMVTAKNNRLYKFLSESILFTEIGGILVSTLFVAVLIICILGVGRLKRSKHTILLTIRQYLLYNFLIRYFQTTFLLLQFASFFAASKSYKTLERVVSSAILTVQFAIVSFIALIYILVPQTKLTKWSNTIGNLYRHIKTSSVSGLCYGLIFYVLRTSISLVLVFG